jgi:hypothetical protein
MMKITPDLGTILANLNSAGLEGPCKEYCLSRINSKDVSPELAKAAYMEAKKLVDAGEAAGSDEVQIGMGKTISVNILEALLNDISVYAKVASARHGILKLADKFASKIK